MKVRKRSHMMAFRLTNLGHGTHRSIGLPCACRTAQAIRHAAHTSLDASPHCCLQYCCASGDEQTARANAVA